MPAPKSSDQFHQFGSEPPFQFFQHEFHAPRGKQCQQCDRPMTGWERGHDVVCVRCTAEDATITVNPIALTESK